jgi:hypothetical protein
MNKGVVFFFNDFGNRMTNSVILPQLTKRFTKYMEDKDESSDMSLAGPVENQFKFMLHYDPQISLVMDYIELFVQVD